MIRDKLTEKTMKRIAKYCKTNYQKLDKDKMVLGKLLFNYRCHLNSVQRVKEGKADSVYLCVTIDEDGGVIVHFINGINSNSRYQDNTLGWQYQFYNYYIIKKVEENEYDNISGLLMDTKSNLINLHMSWLTKKIIGNSFSI